MYQYNYYLISIITDLSVVTRLGCSMIIHVQIKYMDGKEVILGIAISSTRSFDSKRGERTQSML